MENMLKRIIEADKKAQETVAEAEKRLNGTEEKIAEAREEFSKRLAEEVITKVNEIELEKQRQLEEENRINNERAEKIAQSLEKAYEENKDKWVKEIVERVTAN